MIEVEGPGAPAVVEFRGPAGCPLYRVRLYWAFVTRSEAHDTPDLWQFPMAVRPEPKATASPFRLPALSRPPDTAGVAQPHRETSP